MIDFDGVIRDESARFIAAVRAAPPADRVPSCPDWSVADLTWHLAEVQYFWATIVEGSLEDDSLVPDLERPADDRLAALFDAQSSRLRAALSASNDADSCWTWATDHTVGFVRRRQAHEAAIHRVDAELAAGLSVTPLSSDLAADGIDELFTHMLGGEPPQWATVTPDGRRLRIVADEGGFWTGEFARFTGTSPTSGNEYDLDDFVQRHDDEPVDTTVGGSSDALDRWLWGRGALDELSVTGDPSLAHRLRATIADSTQ